MTRSWSFFVYGIPQAKGSLRAVTPPGGKYSVLVDNNAKQVRPWMKTVADAGRLCQLGRPPWGGPVRLSCVFFFPRPLAHYGAGKNAGIQKANAPSLHAVKPDRDKLLRAVCDALTGIAWVDDSRIVDGETSKFYCRPGRPAGVHITVEILDDQGQWEIPELQPGSDAASAREQVSAQIPFEAVGVREIP